MTWMSENELDFLRRIGTHARKDARPFIGGAEKRRRFLLVNYWKTIRFRHDWGRIDKSLVGREVWRMIRRKDE